MIEHCDATIGSHFILQDYFLLPILVLSIFVAIKSYQLLQKKTRISIYNSVFFFFAFRALMGTIAYLFAQTNAHVFIKIVFYIYCYTGNLMMVLAFFGGLADLGLIQTHSKRASDFMVIPCGILAVLWFSESLSNTPALYIILNFVVPAVIGVAFLVVQIIYLVRSRITPLHLLWLLPTVALFAYSIYNIGDNYFCVVFFSINSVQFALVCLAVICFAQYACLTRNESAYSEIGSINYEERLLF
ncbi:hypothetical protein CYY_008342 [Polysphondylium violaceum]|uniref:Uncharacterized protein n=1 Tax=Polysphondylium violaceum TaxID=133409 RepID=A0A8J4PNI5_9MYCE|nr:hypothetical protein CYY_008342 [Polysphondylium violaceum]